MERSSVRDDDSDGRSFRRVDELSHFVFRLFGIQFRFIVFALFTVTKDLTTAFPAKAFRELGMMSIPALDAKAPEIQNDLDGCIRILVTVNNDIKDIQHVYLQDAKKLRPDR